MRLSLKACLHHVLNILDADTCTKKSCATCFPWTANCSVHTILHAPIKADSYHATLANCSALQCLHHGKLRSVGLKLTLSLTADSCRNKCNVKVCPVSKTSNIWAFDRRMVFDSAQSFSRANSTAPRGERSAHCDELQATQPLLARPSTDS